MRPEDLEHGAQRVAEQYRQAVRDNPGSRYLSIIVPIAEELGPTEDHHKVLMAAAEAGAMQGIAGALAGFANPERGKPVQGD
jgi:hypothetical protein